MGLQELLLHFHPVFGAIVIPPLALGRAGCAALPALRQRRGGHLVPLAARALHGAGRRADGADRDAAAGAAGRVRDRSAGLAAQPADVISNGWVPLAVAAADAAGLSRPGAARVPDASTCEARQSVFTLLMVSFVVLTVIGIAFRGEGMALMWPWEVLVMTDVNQRAAPGQRATYETTVTPAHFLKLAWARRARCWRWKQADWRYGLLRPASRGGRVRRRVHARRGGPISRRAV